MTAETDKTTPDRRARWHLLGQERSALAAVVRHDEIAKWTLAAFLVFLVLPFLPLPGFLTDWVVSYSTDFLVLVAVVALRLGHSRLSSLAEKRFWNDLTLAYGCWLLSGFLLSPYGYGPFPLKVSLTVDILYGLFYIGLVLAVEREPHRSGSERLQGLERTLGWPANTAFVVGLYVYFVVIPAFQNRSYYQSTLPYFYLYIVLDGYLTLRLLLLAGRARSPRWRVLYRLFAASTGLNLLASTSGLVFYSAFKNEIVQALLWKPTIVVFILFVRARHQLAETVEPEPTRNTKDAFRGQTLFFALAFPLIHFVCDKLDLLDEPGHASREWLVLIWLLLIGTVALVQHRILERHHAALTLDREELAEELAWRERAQTEKEGLIAELAERSAEVERFTYSVAHDLRAPVFTIEGFVGLVEQDLDRGQGERARTDLRTIRAAANKMRRNLDELLQLLQAGRQDYQWVEVELGEAAADAVRALGEKVDGVEVRISPDLPSIPADPLRLGEVLRNLLDNALTHMGRQDGPRIEIGSRLDGEEIVVYVRDNGVGIDPRYHERIFELFERLDASSSSTGVGLTLVRRIVERHGGRVWVESEGLGRGATFCFTLGEASAGEVG